MQGKETVTPRETEPKQPASIGESPVEAWVSSGGGCTGSSSLEGAPWHKCPWRLPLTLPYNPQTPGLGDFRPKTVRECKPTQQQIIGLKLY